MTLYRKVPVPVAGSRICTLWVSIGSVPLPIFFGRVSLTLGYAEQAPYFQDSNYEICEIVQKDGFSSFCFALSGYLSGISPVIRPLWAYLCQQSVSRQVNVSQGQRGKCATGVLDQTTVAYFRKTPQSFDHGKDVLDSSPYL